MGRTPPKSIKKILTVLMLLGVFALQACAGGACGGGGSECGNPTLNPNSEPSVEPLPVASEDPEGPLQGKPWGGGSLQPSKGYNEQSGTEGSVTGDGEGTSGDSEGTTTDGTTTGGDDGGESRPHRDPDSRPLPLPAPKPKPPFDVNKMNQADGESTL